MPSKGEEKYLYDDKALEKYRKTHRGSSLQRCEVLGVRWMPNSCGRPHWIRKRQIVEISRIEEILAVASGVRPKFSWVRMCRQKSLYLRSRYGIRRLVLLPRRFHITGRRSLGQRDETFWSSKNGAARGSGINPTPRLFWSKGMTQIGGGSSMAGS